MLNSQVLRRKAIKTFQWTLSCSLLWLLWQYVVTPHTSRAFVAGPGATWTRLKLWESDGTLWHLLATTLGEAGMGFVIGCSVGVLLALAVSLLPSLIGEVIEPTVTAIYAMPKFVLIPLFVVWLHSGTLPRTLFVVLVLFPAMFIYTISGIRTIDPDRVQMLRLLGAGRSQIARKLLMPHTMGYITTGLTIQAPHAISIAVGAEILFGVQDGIGGTLFNAASEFQSSSVFSALAIGTAVSAIAIAISRRLGTRLSGVEVRAF